MKGYLCIVTTLFLWAGFFLSLKGGANSNLTPADIALTRFLVPALILLPFVWNASAQIFHVPKRYLLGLFIGSGLPYLLVASTAMQFVPVAHGSALVPGTLPLFVSGIAVQFFGQPLSRHRILGLILVIIGIGLFLASSLGAYQSSMINGHALFLMGSLMWAVFSICARVSNLNALVVSGLVAMWSLLALLLLIVSNSIESHLWVTATEKWPWKELLTHTLLQGIGAGLIASYTYLQAIRRLGAERSAAFGSATPVLATLLAIPVFNEIPSVSTWAALLFISLGSLIASNIFLKNDQSLNYTPTNYTNK